MHGTEVNSITTENQQSTDILQANYHLKVQNYPLIGGSRGGRPNSFDFMQFSGKFGVFTPPLEGSRPPLGKILDPPLPL